MTKVLVVGAKPGSLGRNVVAACRRIGHQTVPAGVAGEGEYLDLVTMSDGVLRMELARIQPDHIVCTAGMNDPEAAYSGRTREYYRDHFAVNCIGPMRLLNAWQAVAPQDGQAHHYVAISSNSARVPRTGSAAYCASKAALSQALRVKARETAGMAGEDGGGIVVYGYEPGLLAGTPMTAQTAADFPGVPLTRMRPRTLSEGVSALLLAEMVVNNLSTDWALNGCMLPFDADER
jgi:NAD(P)-dependent dehydrogenase (short-subunit alcohol dehydrogenase family)